MLMSCATAKPIHRLAQKDVQDAMLERRDELLLCVEEERRRAPTSHGKVLLHFRISRSGDTSELSTTGAGPDLDSCLRGVLASTRFPPHEVEAPDPVTWPMQF
jgi:hypothetical protein